jgi:hypothetical protein
MSSHVVWRGVLFSITLPTTSEREYIYFHVFKVAVADNLIKAAEIQVIVDALKDCTTLQVLDLYCMCIVGFTQNMLVISFQYIIPQHMQPWFMFIKVLGTIEHSFFILFIVRAPRWPYIVCITYFLHARYYWRSCMLNFVVTVYVDVVNVAWYKRFVVEYHMV